MPLDLYLFGLLYDFFHRYAVLAWFINSISSYLIYFLVFIFILFLLFKVSWRKRLYLLSLTTITVIITRGMVTELIRFFYYRPRPFIELDLPSIGQPATGSLPSGHMAFLVPLALAAWCENKKLGRWLLSFTLVIGVARVASGLHWPTDVLAGIAIGGLIFYVMQKLIPKSKP